jgi:hypothetical protein
MAYDALRAYRENLNWQVGGERMMDLLRAAMNPRGTGAAQAGRPLTPVNVA